MKIVLQYKGQKFSLYAIVCNDGSCPSVEFLDELKKNDPSSHKSIVNIYLRHADFGQILNIEKSRPINGRENLFEFKSKQGARLLYFYLPGRRTVFTHGFYKGDPNEPEYDKAEKMRNQYIKECEDER
jgi:hypothetical protein